MQNNNTAGEGGGGGEWQPLVLKSVWDKDKVVRYQDGDGKPQWHCTWCMATFASHSTTKALYHVTKTSGGDVCPCQSKNIDAVFQEAYKTLLNSKNHKHSSKAAASESFASSVSQHNITVSNMLEDSQKTKQHANSNTAGNYGASSNIVSYLNQQSASTSSSMSIASSI